MLLKLYLYGYLNRIRSSRRLELECERNIELHWLLHRLTPQYHTISDFRKDNSDALKAVFKEFNQFCIAMSLIESETIVVDGTKIKAQNSKKNNFNAARLEKLLVRIENKSQEYEHYLKELDYQDAQETQVATAVLAGGKTKDQIESTLELLKERKIKYEEFQRQLKKATDEGCKTEDLQISTVDPDARSLSFKNRHTEVGYNIQTVADDKNSLIVHFEVTNIGDDNALSEIAIGAKEVLGLKKEETLNALADAGYYNGTELAKCVEQGIITFVCVPETASEKEKASDESQTFDKNQFVYDERSDAYTCPNNQQLKSNGTWYEHKATTKRTKPRKYKQYTLPSQTCKACPFAAQCQRNRHKHSHGKTIMRFEADDAVQANRKRMKENPQTYQRRKEVIEHPFGTIKRSWGYYYTLVKTKKKVGGEFALIYLCYNLRRVFSILGVKGFKEALNSHQYMIFDILRLLRKGFSKYCQNTLNFKLAQKVSMEF